MRMLAYASSNGSVIFIQMTISSRKTSKERRIDEMVATLDDADTLGSVIQKAIYCAEIAFITAVFQILSQSLEPIADLNCSKGSNPSLDHLMCCCPLQR